MLGDYVPTRKFYPVPYDRGLGPPKYPNMKEYDISQNFHNGPPLSLVRQSMDADPYLKPAQGAPALPGIDQNLGLFWLPLIAGAGATAGGAYLYGRIKDWWTGSGSETEKNEIENEIIAEHLKYRQTGGSEGIDQQTAEELIELLNSGKFPSWLPYAIGGAALVLLFFLAKK